MAGLNDDAQWIVMMGFVVSFSFFFLAMILNQSTVVGQTTAESVLDFPKNDIRDVRNVIINSTETGDPGYVHDDIIVISQFRKNAVVYYDCPPNTPANPPDPQITLCPSNSFTSIDIHYNNGVTAYNETWIPS
ncbi:MAG: hypothetical protein WCE46_09365 [Methanoregula sp.]|jgi:hypothetical protein|uniref:hypothetical protein n=1 Tax=Methanoregula sp. TaxID=2052170 RepID=UPI003C77DF01